MCKRIKKLYVKCQASIWIHDSEHVLTQLPTGTSRDEVGEMFYSQSFVTINPMKLFTNISNSNFQGIRFLCHGQAVALMCIYPFRDLHMYTSLKIITFKITPKKGNIERACIEKIIFDF